MNGYKVAQCFPAERLRCVILYGGFVALSIEHNKSIVTILPLDKLAEACLCKLPVGLVFAVDDTFAHSNSASIYFEHGVDLLGYQIALRDNYEVHDKDCVMHVEFPPRVCYIFILFIELYLASITSWTAQMFFYTSRHSQQLGKPLALSHTAPSVV